MEAGKGPKRHETEIVRLHETDSRTKSVEEVEQKVREDLAQIPEPKWRKPAYLPLQSSRADESTIPNETECQEEKRVTDIEKEVREQLAKIPEPKWRKPTYLSSTKM